MRLKPNLGIYRRALVNLLLAALVEDEQVKYAEECLNLIDLFVRSMVNSKPLGSRSYSSDTITGGVSDNIQRIENRTKTFIERMEREARAVESMSTTAAAAPVSGLPSDLMDVHTHPGDTKAEQSKENEEKGKAMYTYRSSQSEENEEKGKAMYTYRSSSTGGTHIPNTTDGESLISKD